MKCIIKNVAEGCAEGEFECTEEQFEFLQYVMDCQGNKYDEGYAGSCYIEKTD